MNLIQSRIQQIAREGYFVYPSFIEEDEVKNLFHEARTLNQTGQFQNAGVGRNSQHEFRKEIRQDSTLWFQSESLSPHQQSLWEKMEELRLEINKELRLGAFDLEGHYAFYPPGGFYRKHRDRFQNDDRRVVSVVLYLTPEWRVGDGGHLRLHTACGTYDVQPRPGTLVCFLSGEMEHEVLPTRKDRYSFAGWFRKSGALI